MEGDPIKRKLNHGCFVISLDFELNWGMFDVNEGGHYNENILGVYEALPKLLGLFAEYEIHVTWATVGLLFCETKEEGTAALKTINPTYENEKYNPLLHIKTIGDNEKTDPFHFGRSLIAQISKVPHQEIATHTFSHYYCLEKGQTVEQFRADLVHAKKMHERFNVPFVSIVFPRNQLNNDYLDICVEQGLESYRGNPEKEIYRASQFNQRNYLKRVIKLLDSYINLFGHHVFAIESLNRHKTAVDIPGSMFLRPYEKRLEFLEKLKIRRIKRSMDYAAKNNKLFHLWWHPHNFGKNVDENLNTLREILQHYRKLNTTYQFQTYTMSELSRKIKGTLKILPFFLNPAMENLLYIL